MKGAQLLVLTFVALLRTANSASDIKYAIDERNLLDTWKEMDREVTKMTNSAIKMLLPQLLEIVNELNLSSQCTKESMQIISGVRRLKIWAVKFVDSSSKMVDGLLSGTITSFGAYQQCLDIVSPTKDAKKSPIRGQYCQIDVEPPLPKKSKIYKYDDEIDELQNFTGSELMNFLAKKANMIYSFPYKFGLCVPSGCSTRQVEQFANKISERNYLSATVNFCEVKKKTNISETNIFIIVLYCFLACITLLGTSYEIYLNKKETLIKSGWQRVIFSFSVISNFRRLFNVQTSNDKLRCLYGIKFLGVTMMAMAHTYLYPAFMMHMYESLFIVYDLMRYPMGQMIMSAHVSIDTLFCLSGLLVCYLTIKHVKIDEQELDLKLFLIHKLWRLAPLYYLILLFSLLTPLMGSGPTFRDAMRLSTDNCYRYWWRNLLFINNLFSSDESCLMHTWYVSCDLQLYLSSLLVILPLIRSQTLGLTINILIIVISMVYTSVITYIYDLLPGFYIVYLDKEFISNSFAKTYANPLTHAGPYFIGVLTGYVLIKKPDMKISKKIQTLGWCTSIICGAYTLFWTALWKHYTPSSLETATYSSLYRITWAIAVAWLMFSCINGQGGFINTFLNWKPWIPLAKLSFLIYILQPMMLTMYIAVFKTTHEFTHFQLIVLHFGMILTSGLLALLLNLMLESPLIALEKALFQKSDAKTVANEIQHSNDVLKPEIKFEMELNDLSSPRNCYANNEAFVNCT